MLDQIKDPGIMLKTDWRRIQRCFQTASDEIDQGRWDFRDNGYDAVGIQSKVYSFGTYGLISTTTALNGSSWKFWSGQWLESLLPWAAGMRKELARAGLPLGTIAYHSHNYSVVAHRDRQYLNNDPDTPHTNVNYMISSENPEQSYTWVEDDHGNRKGYYSYPDTLWIINASNLHAVETNGHRDALIMKFYQSFEDIENFFKLHPDFFDENQPYFKS
jgi:hypothetical protein